MAGMPVPDDWRGAMNVTYTFGGAFKNKGW